MKYEEFKAYQHEQNVALGKAAWRIIGVTFVFGFLVWAGLGIFFSPNTLERQQAAERAQQASYARAFIPR